LGAVVSLGHSNADYEQSCVALEAGASCFTHLFNAMSQMTGRAPGMVGAALSSKAFAGFICDGHHVDDATLAVALSVEGAKERLFLVSDAMPTVGGPDGFSLYGMEVRLEGGKLVNRDGNLAGAHVTMAGSVSRAVKQLNLSIEEALRMAIATPATVLGLAGGIDILDMRSEELLVWSNGLEECRWLNLDGLERSSK
jgi:N-acetylglucosamine-6-phosphate deacetylase